MATQTVVKIPRIDLDEHPHMLLGFLGAPIEKLNRDRALEELHQTIYNSTNLRLEVLAKRAAAYFAQKHHLDEHLPELLKNDFLEQLKYTREHWLRRQLQKARV